MPAESATLNVKTSNRWWDSVRRDVRVSIRVLLRHRTFTLTATIALALAIAVNTSMFSIIDAMVNPTAGGRDPDQLYAFHYWGKIGKRSDVSWRERLVGTSGRTYQATTGSQGTGFFGGTVERGGVVRQVAPAFIRPNYFAMIGIEPLEGTLSPSPDRAAAATTVIISDRIRAGLFRSGESPIGQLVVVDGKPVKVIGVVRHLDSMMGLDRDVWMFPAPGRDIEISLIRLKPGVSVEAARGEFSVIAAQLAVAEGEKTQDTRSDLRPVKQQFEIKRFHWALIGSAIAVFLVACANLANLQLARGLGRASEMALRSALGASRRQIVRQLVIETAILATASMLLAIALSLAGNAIIRATIPPGIGGYVIEPQSSWRMVLFAGLASVISLTLVGLVPAIRVSRVDINTLIKSRTGTGAHKGNSRIYGTLVIAQIAFTLPLVTAAVLVARSMLRVTSRNHLLAESIGYDTRRLIVATILYPPSDSTRSMAEIGNRLVARARAVDGVSNAAAEFSHRFEGNAVTVDYEEGGLREIPSVSGYQIVTPGYFRTLGLPMERGTDFSEGLPAEGTVIMNRTTGWYLWPRASSKGRSIKLAAQTLDAPWLRVQGIIGDHLSEEARTLQREKDTLRITSIYKVLSSRDSLRPLKYFSWVSLTVRAKDNPQRVATALRRAFSDVSTRPPTVSLWEEAQGIPQRIAVLKFVAALFTTFGLLALGLSALGVYGIVAQSVADRKREVAVRISLGATPKRILYVLLREGNVLVLAGVAIGLYVSKETMTWLEQFVGEVDLTNALLFGFLCIALFCAMVGAAMIPAWQSTRMNCMDVLRSE